MEYVNFGKAGVKVSPLQYLCRKTVAPPIKPRRGVLLGWAWDSEDGAVS